MTIYQTNRDTILALFQIKVAKKCDKKSVLRFYNQQHFSAGFIGFDTCYLVMDNTKIIAAVIISQLYVTHQFNFLHALVVDKNYRQQGIGKLLVNHVVYKHPMLICFAEKKLMDFYYKLNFHQKQATDLSEVLARRYHQYVQSMPSLKIFSYSVINHIEKTV